MKKLCLFLLIWANLFVARDIQAESVDRDSSQTSETNQSYNFFTDKTNLLSLGFGFGFAFFLYDQDQHTYDEFIEPDNKLPAQDYMLEFSRNYGKGSFMIPVLATIWLSAKTMPGSKLEIATNNAIKSFILSGAIVATLKLGFHRYRPYTGKSSHKFEGPDFTKFDTDSMAFPSGDSQTAWSILTSYALSFADTSIWAPIGFYFVATLVTLGRVYDKAHWPSDAFLGSLIGFSTAYNVYQYDNANQEKINDFSFIPIINHNEFGISMEYNF